MWIPKRGSVLAPTTFQRTVYANSSYEKYEYAYRAIDPGRGKLVHFVIGDKVQVVGPDGKVIANTDVKKNARVHPRLVQEGDRTVIDQVNVEELK